jgi:hypothetical protein
MERSGSAIHPSNQPDWLDEQLKRVCRNLLQRPQGRRGPFIISDTDLRAWAEEKVPARRSTVPALLDQPVNA